MKKKLFFLILLCVTFLYACDSARAADIYVSTPTASVSENQTFTVSVYTDTKGASINNIESVISFPHDLLSVASIDTSGSIFSLWVEQPAFSNTNGTISFNGGVPTPGYKGSRGKVIGIVFVAKKAGAAQLSFSSADIYADDGLGTDVVSGKTGTIITITAQKPVEQRTAPVETKTQVADTTGPVHLSVASSITEDDHIALAMTSQDAQSGVAKYKVSIDGVFALEQVAKTTAETDVVLPTEQSGNHEVGVRVYDNAGNLSEKIQTIEFPTIQSPKITKYPQAVTQGDTLELSGVSYANSDLRVWLKGESGEEKSYGVKALDDGTFSFTSGPIDIAGTLSIWAEAVRDNNISSSPSPTYSVQVNKPAYIQISIFTIKVLAVMIPALLLLIVLIYIGLHGLHKLKKVRSKLSSELVETETEAHKIFKLLTEDAKEILKVFKKSEVSEKLNEEDMETVSTLTEDIKEAEEYFTKRIQVIEKQSKR